MKRVLASIEEKQNEARYLREVLELWNACPYPSEDVKAFTWRPEFLDKEHTRTYRQMGPITFVKKKFDFGPDACHNCVRMTNGELKPIPLTRRPKR